MIYNSPKTSIIEKGLKKLKQQLKKNGGRSYMHEIC